VRGGELRVEDGQQQQYGCVLNYSFHKQRELILHLCLMKKKFPHLFGLVKAKQCLDWAEVEIW
jgi:hypothetical protein